MKTRLLFLFLLLALRLSPPVQAQPSDLRFKHLTTADGLSQRIVYDVLEDAEGYLWFATRDGLNRYDGHRFKVYRHVPGDTTTLSDSKALVLLEDRDRVLWVGTMEGGLNRFDRRTETFTHFRHDPEDPRSVPDNRITALAQDTTGALWVGTYRQGVSRFDPATGRFTSGYRLVEDTARALAISSLLYDRRHRLWVGSYGYGHLCLLDPARAGCSRRYLEGYTTLALLEDDGDTLWVVAAKAPHVAENPYWLFRLDATTGRVLERHPFPAGGTRDLIRDRRGKLWISSHAGLFSFDPARKRFSHHRHDPFNPAALLDDDIWSLKEDRSGALWIGTPAGVSVYRPEEQRFRLYRGERDRPNSLSDNYINGLAETRDGALWAGTSYGLNRIDRARGTVTRILRDPVPTADPRFINRIWSLLEDRRGVLWIGTGRAGLHRYDARTGAFAHEVGLHQTLLAADRHTVYRFTRDTYPVSALYEDRAGVLWVGTRNGLARRDPRTGQYTVYRHDPKDPHSLSHDYVNVIYEDAAGWLWLGTDYGLNRLDRATGRFTRYVHDPGDPTTLSANIIWTMMESPATPGLLWVGTVGGGLNRFDPRTGAFQALTTADGLPNDNLYGLLPDDHGNLWMSTGHGIARLDPRAGTFLNFDEGDGLQDDEFNFMASYRSPRTGELFFGGPRGLNSFFPDSIRASDYAPPVVLTGLRIFDAERAGMLSAGDTITLPYRQNFFTLTFAALDYVNPTHNRYRYRLEGVDRQWRETDGTRPEAAYTDVPPGRYRFVVEGTNHDGVASPHRAHLHLVITPPFWQRWWFRLLLLAALGALLTGLYRYRVHSLLQVERTRRRIADDLHDDIGSKMSTIALMADVAGRHPHLDDESRKQVSTIAETARQVAQDLRDTVWVIDAGRDTLEGLVQRMRSTAQHMLQGLPHTIVLPDALPPLSLGMDLRRNLLLIFKEALHNAVRHAGAARVDVTVTMADGVLSVRVCDDGRGFDLPLDREGRGQRTMRARAEAIGGTLHVESRPGHGTAVSLSVRVA